MTLKSMGNFLGPLLVYSALTGLVTAFMLGALVTVVGFCAAIPPFVSDSFSAALMMVFKAFPSYAIWVVIAVIIGLVCGFITGLVYALTSGKPDYWFSFLAFIGFGAASSSMIIFSCVPILIVGSIAAQYPEFYLLKRPLNHQILKPLREYLSNSWIPDPPKFARIIAYPLPLLIGGILNVYF